MSTTQYSYKQIWLVAYPILISLFMEHLIGLTDTAFLGRVGEVELGASALGGVFYMALFMPAFGFSVGAQILIARRNGEGRLGEIGPLFQQGFIFLVALAALLFGLTKAFAPRLLGMLISSHDVYAAAIDYLDWRIYGFFFAFAASVFRAFYVGITQTRVLTLNSLVMVLSNAVLNYALIFGKFGLPQLGIAGAAIASSVAELVSLLFFMIYTWQRADWRRYNLFRRVRFAPHLLSSMLGVSVWTMIQSFISVSTWFIFFVSIEQLGERPLAISNIVRSISSLLFIFMNAFAATTSSLVSNLMGAGHPQQVMKLCGRVIRMGYAVLLPLMLVIVLFPTAVLRIYTDSAELISASVPSLYVMVSVYLIYVPSMMWFNAVSGTGNTRSALGMELGALAVYMLYVYYVVDYLRADVAVCWTSEHAYSLVLLIFVYWYMKKANWQAKKI